MPNDRFTDEIVRLAARKGYVSKMVDSACIGIWQDSIHLLDVIPEKNYEIRYKKEIGSVDDLRRKVYEFSDAVAAVREYVDAFEKAPPLVAEGLTDGYRLIAEHNKTVLAAKHMALNILRMETSFKGSISDKQFNCLLDERYLEKLLVCWIRS